MLPKALWLKIGRLLGLVLFWVLKKRKKVIKRNIELCFPQLGANEQTELQNKNICELGVGVLEFFACCFKKNDYLLKEIGFVNFEYLQAAVAKKSGVIIFVPHSSTMFITISALALRIPVNVLHRPFKHDALRGMLDKLSCKTGMKLIAQRDVKRMVGVLKNKDNLVILPDHDMGRAATVFANFFGIKAATTVSIFKLAKSTGAEIVSLYSYRMDDGKVCVECSGELNKYRDSSHLDAAAAMNKYLEDNVNRYKWQYYWPHRRFKTRPLDEEHLY